MNSGNPLHPVVLELRSEWHKIAALLMKAMGVDTFEITSELVQQLAVAKVNIVADTRGGKFIIRLVSDEKLGSLVRQDAEGN